MKKHSLSDFKIKNENLTKYASNSSKKFVHIIESIKKMVGEKDFSLCDCYGINNDCFENKHDKDA